MITPPELLVERAWKRGLEFGRYKAVDDTLAHSVEAYTGMPDVFFTWVQRTDKQIQLRISGQHRAARRAAAHGRLRYQLHVQCAGRRRAFWTSSATGG